MLLIYGICIYGGNGGTVNTFNDNEDVIKEKNVRQKNIGILGIDINYIDITEYDGAGIANNQNQINYEAKIGYNMEIPFYKDTLKNGWNDTTISSNYSNFIENTNQNNAEMDDASHICTSNIIKLKNHEDNRKVDVLSLFDYPLKIIFASDQIKLYEKNKNKTNTKDIVFSKNILLSYANGNIFLWNRICSFWKRK